jgi:hypothetical protein
MTIVSLKEWVSAVYFKEYDSAIVSEIRNDIYLVKKLTQYTATFQSSRTMWKFPTAEWTAK